VKAVVGALRVGVVTVVPLEYVEPPVADGDAVPDWAAAMAEKARTMIAENCILKDGGVFEGVVMKKVERVDRVI